MHMTLHVWKTVGGLLFCIGATALASAGCSSSSTTSTTIVAPTGCTADTTIDCSGGGDGFACDAGDNPEAEDTTLSCSTPTANGSEDDFCCFTFTSSTSTCSADDGLTAVCPDADSYGYVCAAGDDPTSLDGSLNCSDGVPDSDGTDTDFCCTLGSGGGTSSGGTSSGGTIVAPTGCTADDSVDCSGGGDGFSCDAGDNPEVEDSSLSCSTPTANGAEDDFCCFTFSPGSSSCSADDDLTTECPDADSYGYQCSDPSDDPSSLDSSLNCSAGVPDPDGTDTDFCCTLQ
jgi:hypothetical protein